MPGTLYHVTIGSRLVRVQVRHQGDHTFVRLDDGDERPAQLDTVRGVLRSLLIGDRHTELLATASKDGAVLAMGGQECLAEVLDDAHARLASSAANRPGGHARRELRAPMPGLLVSMLCGVGDAVQPGQPLAILQAMKMENELSLPRGGTVTSVSAEPGQTVDQGQVLVVVE
jgi:propionyl-CoA carboxylase alpha chain